MNKQDTEARKVEERADAQKYIYPHYSRGHNYHEQTHVRYTIQPHFDITLLDSSILLSAGTRIARPNNIAGIQHRLDTPTMPPCSSQATQSPNQHCWFAVLFDAGTPTQSNANELVPDVHETVTS